MAWLLLLLISAPLVHSQDQRRPGRNGPCNQNGTLCVKTVVEQSVVQNPFSFEVQVKCPAQIVLAWELRDDSGKMLDVDPRGTLSFLVKKLSASERILAVRDFALRPAQTDHGKLILRATTYSISGVNQLLPELSIPLRLDTRTTDVTYAIPANGKFSRAVIDSVEADPAHRVQMQAEVDWRSTTLLFVQPAMLGGAAAEAAARAHAGQDAWHAINYSKAQGTAHLTTLGGAWAGVGYYLTGLRYLLEKTLEHQPGVRSVIYNKSPDFGQ